MEILNFFLNDSKIFLPEIFLFISGMFVLVIGVVYSMDSSYRYPILTRPVLWLVILTLFFTFLLLVNNPFDNAFGFNNFLISDLLANSSKIIVVISTIFILLLSLDYIRFEKVNSFEFSVLILFAVGGLLLVISSYDLIALYLAIELQSLVLYVLATIRRKSEYSTESGLKYFILGAVSSGLLLLGCSFVYGFTGLTNFEELFRLFSFVDANTYFILDGNGIGFLLGIVLIVVALFFKLSVAPFHLWTPDVYEGSATPITAFFAVVPKLAIFSLFLRLFLDILNQFFFDYWQFLFASFALFSIFVATFGALYQKKLKRLFAFSAIGHLGFILLGFSSGTFQGVESLFVYFLIYIVMNLGIFGVILSLRTSKPFSQVRFLSDLVSLSRSNPLLAFTFIILLFSIAGIPPLAGFFSKFYIFLAALGSSLYFFAIVGIILSVIGCFYYIRLIKLMYFEHIVKWPLYLPVSRENSLILGFSFFFVILFFVYPSPIFTFAGKIALILNV